MQPKSGPSESTQNTRSTRSMLPSFFSQPPSDATDTTVPAVSKKSDSMSENTARIATKKPSLNTSRRPKLPFTDVNTAPIVEKSGVGKNDFGITATPGRGRYVTPAVAAFTATTMTDA